MNIFSLPFLLLFPFAIAFFDPKPEILVSAPPDRQPVEESEKGVAANIIFRSIDGGETWQDISEGLPLDEQTDGFVEKDNDLYVRVGNGMYHGKPNSAAPYWRREIFPDAESHLASGTNGLLTYHYSGRFSQRMGRTGAWLPMYKSFHEKGVRTVFEMGSTVFIGSDCGIFKSANSGSTWKRVHAGGWVMKVVAADGVLLATSQSGILRSTDEGESWELVISEGGVGIAVERIEGGFAAIMFNTASNTRRVRTSYDGGKTWQPIDIGLPPSLTITSIVQVGNALFCGHPEGIFRSTDNGKTWKRLLPSIGDKVFNLSASGRVIYAMPRAGGC